MSKICKSSLLSSWPIFSVKSNSFLVGLKPPPHSLDLRFRLLNGSCWVFDVFQVRNMGFDPPGVPVFFCPLGIRSKDHQAILSPTVTILELSLLNWMSVTQD